MFIRKPTFDANGTRLKLLLIVISAQVGIQE
jgi:hypothetical protein